MESNIVDVGLEYGSGAPNVNPGWTRNKYDENDLDDSRLFVVSGDIGILPGVTLKANVGHNTEDLNGRDDTIVEQDTIVGVVSVQLDY